MEWAAMSSSRRYFQPRDRTQVLALNKGNGSYLWSISLLCAKHSTNPFAMPNTTVATLAGSPSEPKNAIYYLHRVNQEEMNCTGS